MSKSEARKYSIHDTEEQYIRIRAAHGIASAQAEALRKATGKQVTLWNLGKALKSMYRKYSRHVGGMNKYSPHQGAKEKARRLRQMGRGNV